MLHKDTKILPSKCVKWTETGLHIKTRGVHDGVKLDVLLASLDAVLVNPLDRLSNEVTVFSVEERDKVGGEENPFAAKFILGDHFLCQSRVSRLFLHS